MTPSASGTKPSNLLESGVGRGERRRWRWRERTGRCECFYGEALGCILASDQKQSSIRRLPFPPREVGEKSCRVSSPLRFFLSSFRQSHLLCGNTSHNRVTSRGRPRKPPRGHNSTAPRLTEEPTVCMDRPSQIRGMRSHPTKDSGQSDATSIALRSCEFSRKLIPALHPNPRTVQGILRLIVG